MIIIILFSIQSFKKVILNICDLVYLCRNEGKAGHFAAMENPKLIAADVHKFVNVVETLREKQAQKVKKTKSQEKQKGDL